MEIRLQLIISATKAKRFQLHSTTNFNLGQSSKTSVYKTDSATRGE